MSSEDLKNSHITCTFTEPTFQGRDPKWAVAFRSQPHGHSSRAMLGTQAPGVLSTWRKLALRALIQNRVQWNHFLLNRTSPNKEDS